MIYGSGSTIIASDNKPETSRFPPQLADFAVLETIRVQSDRKKLSSDAVLQALEHFGQFGLWSKDLFTAEEQWSPGLQKILGLNDDKELISYAKFIDRVHPNDRRWFAEKVGIEFHAIPFEGRIRIVQPAGMLRWIHIRNMVFFSENGVSDYILYLISDVTDHHHAVEALSEQERRLEALAESFRCSLYTVTPDGKKTFVHQWRALGLRSGSEHSDLAFLDGVIPSDRERAKRHKQDHLLEKKPSIIQYRRVSVVTGEILNMAFFTKPIFGREGEIIEWIGLTVQIDGLFDDRSARIEISGRHVRAARSLLGWSIEKLSRRSGVSTSTIRRFESSPALSARSQLGRSIVEALENSGVRFSPAATGATAISLKDSD